MRRGYSHLPPLILIWLLFSTLSYGQAWSGILSPARAVDWTQAGLPGGIPSRTTICANVLTSDNTAAIQSKINACPANQVVKFPTGTWNLSGNIFANKGIVLRGNGPTNTLINLGSGNILLSTAGSGYMGSYPSNLGSTSWTGGLTRGSTVLTVASTAGMAAAQRVVLDQHNASYVFTLAVEGECTSGNSCGRNDSPLQFNGADSRAQEEIVEIQSVDSSTQITIAAPGISHDYASGLTPQIFYWNKTGSQGPGNIEFAGVEDMTINANGNDFAISMPFCDYCWVKNVAITNIARSAVFFFWSYRDEVRDSYISASNTSGAPTEYGIEVLQSSFTKIENNIFFGVTANLMPESSYGLVAGYNYALNTATGPQFGSFEPHLAHNFLQLYEGNVIDEVMYDNSWGSSSQNTSFRNRMSGHSPNKSNYRAALKVNAHNHYMNIVGNVLGDPTFHTRYRCDNVDTNQSDNFVYDLGFWNSCENGIDANNPYDTVTQSSLMRWGNWDGVTWKANGNTNGVRWCTGSGAGNSACTASETASTDPTFPGLASPSTNLPASFYNGATSAFPSCGTGLSFWKNPSTGTCPLYPPIGPDVACTTNCIANTANHAAMIPAQLCYTNTAKDGNGFLTAFDANACYANDPSSTAGGPMPPTGLSALVQ
ncbi:MAG: glycoside hydrolase family 55 protein [Acidobacteriia bacterium]|nr:glycoside hydrolase family 55 protein [Terriglobia bacterium]